MDQLCRGPRDSHRSCRPHIPLPLLQGSQRVFFVGCVCVCVCVNCPLHRREPLRRGLLIYLIRSLRACAKRDTSVRLAGCRFLRCQTPSERRTYLVVIADDELDLCILVQAPRLPGSLCCSRRLLQGPWPVRSPCVVAAG